MNLWDIALRNLKRRKSKAAFVLVGLTIGVSAVVVFISLAEALTQNINSKLEEYGANILIVPSAWRRPSPRTSTASWRSTGPTS